MALVHDDDLETIGGLGPYSVSRLLNSNHTVPLWWQSIETLEPGVMADLLRGSSIETNEVRFCKLNL